MARPTKRSFYASQIKQEIFGSGRSAAWIAEKTGIPESTVRSWRADPGKMPAYQYLSIKKLIGGKDVK